MQLNATARIGEIVRTERERQGLTQEELALAAGVSYRTVLQIENGKTTSRVDVVLRVLEALGLTLEVRAASRSLSRSASLPLARFEVYADEAGSYRWRLKAANNETVAVGSAAYPTRSAVQGAIEHIASARGNPAGGATRVYRIDNGSYRWHFALANGEIVAEGADSYPTQSAARRAASHAMLAATVSEV